MPWCGRPLKVIGMRWAAHYARRDWAIVMTFDVIEITVAALLHDVIDILCFKSFCPRTAVYELQRLRQKKPPPRAPPSVP